MRGIAKLGTFSNGMAANARCQIYFWAIRDRFDRTGHPKDLTWITIGAQGSKIFLDGFQGKLMQNQRANIIDAPV